MKSRSKASTRRKTSHRKKKLVGGMQFDKQENVKLSTNGIFYINRNDAEEEHLYIRVAEAEGLENENGFILISRFERPDATVSEIGLQREGGKIDIADGHLYYKYRYDAKNSGQEKEFENDCLRFAETVAHGHAIGDMCGFYVRNSGQDAVIGISDERNVALVNQNPLDETANPDVGDAFFIVQALGYEKKLRRGQKGCPHHAGYVIAADEDTRITMEADAGTELASPVFNMYSVNSNTRMTFHDTWHCVYSGNTTVLRALPEPVKC